MLKLNTKKVNRELKRLGWNNQRLQVEMGIARTSVYYYLKQDTSLKRVERIAKALSLDPKDLLT